MADADGRIIPHIGEDMGEGVKDFMSMEEIVQNKMQDTLRKEIQHELEKGKTENEMLQLILDKIEALDRKIDRIFGGCYLINGKFQHPNVLLKTGGNVGQRVE